MKLQITEQANGKFSVYTDSGADTSMADEELIGSDLEQEQAETMVSEALIGQQRTLAYPDEFKTLPDYTAHRGQVVTVKRELRDGDEYDREDGERMYEVVAADGWIGHAYESELA